MYVAEGDRFFCMFILFTKIKWKRGGSQKQTFGFLGEIEFNPLQHMVKKGEKSLVLKNKW